MKLQPTTNWKNLPRSWFKSRCKIHQWQYLRYFWFKYDLGQKYQAPQVQPDWGSNSLPPDHDSTLQVTETPALTTRPSMTSDIFGSSTT